MAGRPSLDFWLLMSALARLMRPRSDAADSPSGRVIVRGTIAWPKIWLSPMVPLIVIWIGLARPCADRRTIRALTSRNDGCERGPREDL